MNGWKAMKTITINLSFLKWISKQRTLKDAKSSKTPKKKK
jgi:hypothetical protein